MSLEKRVDALEKMVVLGNDANKNFMGILKETKTLIDAFDGDLNNFSERIKLLEDRVTILENLGQKNIDVLNALVKIIESGIGRMENDRGNIKPN